MLDAIARRQGLASVQPKAGDLVTHLWQMKLREAVQWVVAGLQETLIYAPFQDNHRMPIRTQKALGRIIKQSQRDTRVVGAFAGWAVGVDGMCRQHRHIASTKWGRNNIRITEQLFAKAL
jgi:transposase-like protein